MTDPQADLRARLAAKTALEARIPGPLTTFMVALFFGPGGLLPAVAHSTMARWHGREGSYWAAFTAGFAVWVIVVLVVWLANQ